ncbi:MAG: hypothetical protein Kow0074_24580 [Candidatus Zixiibacteriota bacterium]
MIQTVFDVRTRSVAARPPWMWGIALVILVAGLALVAGCSDDDGPTGSAQTGSCVDCHTSKDQILATAEPDTGGGGEDSGEG